MANNLSVVLDGNTDKLQKAIEGAKSTLNQYKGVANNTVGVNEKQINSLNRIITAMEKATNGTKTAKQEQAALRQQLQELQMTWNGLSNEVKNSDFGKAISTSMKAAKAQIKDLNTQMGKAKTSVDNSKGSFSGLGDVAGILGDKLGISASMFTKLGVAGAGIGAAFKIANDAIANNESLVDELGRTMESTTSIYNTFVNSLASGNGFSNLINNLQNVINAAKYAYNAMDDLATKGGIISNREAKIQADIARDTRIINDPTATEAQKKAAQARLKASQIELENAKKQTSRLNFNAVAAKVREKLAEAGITEEKNIQKALVEVKKSLLDPNYNMKNISQTKTTRYMNGKTETRTKTFNLNDIITDEFRKEINPLVQAGYNAIAQANQQGRKTDKQVYKNVSGGITTTKVDTPKPDGLLAKIDDEIKELQNKKLFAKTEEELIQIQTKLDELTNKKREIELNVKIASDIKKNGIGDKNISSMPFSGVPTPTEDEINKDVKDLKIEPIKIDFETDEKKLKKTQEDLKSIGSIFSSIGSVSSESTAQVMNFMGATANAAAQAIPAIMSLIGAKTGEAMASGTASAAALPFPANLGAIATIVGAITSVIASIPSFADGGVFGGSSLYGDHNIARVNAGEMILNGKQQAHLFSMLNHGGNVGGGGIMIPEIKIKGSDLHLALKNYNKTSR